MDASASMQNDSAQTVYTYAAQLPYFNMALKELQEHFELNNIPITNRTSAPLDVVAGTTEIGFATSPALPSDLIDIEQLWERIEGTNPYVPMTKVDFLPHNLEGTLVGPFTWYVWENQTIKVLESLQDNDLKLDYIANLFSLITINDINNHTDTIGIINAASFLQYRTGALVAQFIGENKSRADDLDTFAILGLDRVTGIGTKGRQSITTRRRPFRAGLKSRGI